MSTCDQLSPFADGELDLVEHRAFEDHLDSCSECISGLADYLGIDMAISFADARLARRRALRGAGLAVGVALVVGLLLSLGGLYG